MQLNKRKKNKSAGFTLIELLIVIIIIGILAAIAFVAYTGSQNKAKKADAEATLSQVRSKLAEYNSDEGRYPSDKTEFTTWLGTDEAGNNDALATKFGGASYEYEGTPADCDDDDSCTGYEARALGTLFNGTTIEVTN